MKENTERERALESTVPHIEQKSWNYSPGIIKKNTHRTIKIKQSHRHSMKFTIHIWPFLDIENFDL